MSTPRSNRYIRFYGPILDALRQLGGSGTPREVKSVVLNSTLLSEDDLNRVTPGGVNAVENEISWAGSYLREAGMLDGSERGVWRLTELGGKTFLDVDQARKLRTGIYAKHAQRRKQLALIEEEPEVEGSDPEDVEVLEKPGVLDALKSLSPGGFERFCQLLLRESGFSEVTVTGKTGDGGIDGNGILQVNPLVSFRVLFQCKRYAGSVGPDVIRDFRGAMQGRTDKGIILTTGTFTRAAEQEAVREGAPPIELVDGQKLVELMEHLRLGVVPTTVYRVNEEFFEDYRK